MRSMPYPPSDGHYHREVAALSPYFSSDHLVSFDKMNSHSLFK